MIVKITNDIVTVAPIQLFATSHTDKNIPNKSYESLEDLQKQQKYLYNQKHFQCKRNNITAFIKCLPKHYKSIKTYLLLLNFFGSSEDGTWDFQIYTLSYQGSFSFKNNLNSLSYIQCFCNKEQSHVHYARLTRQCMFEILFALVY